MALAANMVVKPWKGSGRCSLLRPTSTDPQPDSQTALFPGGGAQLGDSAAPRESDSSADLPGCHHQLLTRR
jgi:hypothetical protein